MKTTVFKQIDHLLTDELRECSTIYAEQGMPGLREEFYRETRATSPDELFFRILTPRGETLLSSDLSNWNGIEKELAEERAPVSGAYSYATLKPDDDFLNTRMVSFNLDNQIILQLGMNLARENRYHQRTSQILVGSSLVMIILSTLSGLWIARQAMAGVQRVTRTVEGIRKDSLNRKVPMGKEGREINDLASAFNGMLRRIEALVRELNEVSDNVAHDLRSPITRMRGAAETTLTGPPDPQAYQDMGLTVLEECDRLTEIINTMLEIAQSESGVLDIERSDVDLCALIKNALDLFLPVAEEKKILFLTDIPKDPVIITGDKTRLQRAVANLLDNALKYTPAGGTIRLICHEEEDQIRIEVSDTGNGIPPDELPKIFERFYRGEKSRSSKGNGLGLSLAKAIIQSHGGTLTAKSIHGKGSVFTIALDCTAPGESILHPAQ
jgi:heavy metal sensor kinase